MSTNNDLSLRDAQELFKKWNAGETVPPFVATLFSVAMPPTAIGYNDKPVCVCGSLRTSEQTDWCVRCGRGWVQGQDIHMGQLKGDALLPKLTLNERLAVCLRLHADCDAEYMADIQTALKNGQKDDALHTFVAHAYELMPELAVELSQLNSDLIAAREGCKEYYKRYQSSQNALMPCYSRKNELLDECEKLKNELKAVRAKTLDEAAGFLIRHANNDMVHPSRALSHDGQQYVDRVGDALRQQALDELPEYGSRLDKAILERDAACKENTQLVADVALLRKALKHVCDIALEHIK